MTLADGRVLEAMRWPGRGTPIVLLHGLLDDAEGWTALCASTERPCVVFDLPGFGGSDPPAHPAFSAYAADIQAGLDEIAPGPIVLVGHSLGGAIATALAERIPDRVRALILLAPAGFGRIPLAEAVSMPGVRFVANRLLPTALGNRVAVSGAYRLFVSNGKSPSGELVDRVLRQRSTSAAGAREGTKAVVRGGLSARGFRHRRVAYDGPVSLVWGDHDRVVPIAHVDGVLRALPQAKVQIWRGMGHHPQRERPGRLATLVESTCESATAARRDVAA